MGIRNYAIDYYSTSTASVKLPKLKFAHAVQFMVDPDIPLLQDLYRATQGYTFDVTSVTLPTVTYNTNTVNSYNKKHIYHTNKSYAPVQITLRDTRDSALNVGLAAYDRVFFNSAGPDRPTARNVLGFGNTAEGLKLNDSKDPIQQINIFTYHPNKQKVADQYKLIRPIVTNIARDTVSYADSSPIEISITVEYEYYDYSLVTDAPIPSTIQNDRSSVLGPN